MSPMEQRLALIEERLLVIEARLAAKATSVPPVTHPPSPDGWAPRAAVSQAARPTVTSAARAIPTARTNDLSVATTLLGWGGASALVLAAVYLIRLAIESGWLTPARQVALAAIGGVVLIGVGLYLRRFNRSYASLLPAGGIVILFLAIFGAHLYYGLIGATPAAAAVVAVCLCALWLCRVFESDLYAVFAVVGSYSAPFLLHTFRSDLTDLVIYFSSWSVVFCVFAIWVARRHVYLLALYLALIAFDFLWRQSGSQEWVGAVVFQTVHLIIFASAAAIFSVRHRAPLSTTEAWLHLPALYLFYFLVYLTLGKHVPASAPWIAAASLGFVALIYLAARRALETELAGGRMLLSAYAALVLLHAGYIESVPYRWAPWVALAALPLTALYGYWRGNVRAAGWSVWLVVALVYLVNYLRAVANIDMSAVPAHALLAPLFAVSLYAGYVLIRRMRERVIDAGVLLYGGHIAAMAAAVHLLDSRLSISLAWALLAIAFLFVALARKDKVAGHSSLFIFAAAAVKVFLYDLSFASPVTRIASLLVLGLSLYLGGWLYQKVNLLEAPTQR